MKTLLTALALTLLAPSAQAGEPVKCEVVSRAAKSVMFLRQHGEPMSFSMDVAKDNELLQTIIIAAYEKPNAIGSSAKQNAVNEFRDSWYMQCIKAKI